MLVLSRRVGQAIVIAEDVRVTIISVQGEKVRLGIDAPRSIHVDREEIARRRRAGWDAIGGKPLAESECLAPTAEENGVAVGASLKDA